MFDVVVHVPSNSARTGGFLAESAAPCFVRLFAEAPHASLRFASLGFGAKAVKGVAFGPWGKERKKNKNKKNDDDDDDDVCSVPAFVCRDERVYGHMTTAMHDDEYTPPALPPITSILAKNANPTIFVVVRSVSLPLGPCLVRRCALTSGIARRRGMAAGATG